MFVLDKHTSCPKKTGRPVIHQHMDLWQIVNDSRRGGDASSSDRSDEHRRTSQSPVEKPKRYDAPPVWARPWPRRASYRASGVNTLQPNGLDQSEAAMISERQNSEDIGPGGLPSLCGLKPSISGIIPADDISRRVSVWLYSHFYKMTSEERTQAEIEFKLGQICENGQRVRIPVVTEAVVASAHSYNFKSNVEVPLFSRIETFLNGLGGNGGPDFAQEAQKSVDRIGTQNSQIKGPVRTTFDETGKIIACIRKRRISDLMIWMPDDFVDLRVSLSIEEPLSIPSKVAPGNHERRKNRQSWITKGLRIDMTSVQTSTAGHAGAQSKEVELELDSSMLVTYYESYQDKSDSLAMDKFQEFIRFGLDSCRVLVRAVSRE